MVHCFCPFDARHSDHHILSLEAFLFPEQEIDVDLKPYQAPLEHLLEPFLLQDAFEMKDDPQIGEEARILRGALRRRMAPLVSTEADHNMIYESKKGLGNKAGEGPENPGKGPKKAKRKRRTRARTGAA